jgi:hypothetical protein
MWGFVEAMRNPPQTVQTQSILNPSSQNRTATNAGIASGSPGFSGAAAASQLPRQSGKLILNNILNHITRRGPFLGNSAGVLAMSYNLLNAYVSYPLLFFMSAAFLRHHDF